MEEWRDVSGFEGFYQVSSMGNVRGLRRQVKNGSSFRIKQEKQMKPNTDKDGYKTVTLSKYSKCKTLKIHRLVAVAFIPNPEEKATVNHKNTIKSDNFISNLEWETRKENGAHASINKLYRPKARFIDNKGIKLKPDEVIKIRELRTCGTSVKEISDRFKVTIGNIYLVLSNKTWKHLD